MLIRVSGFACLGGFLYGYDLGLISGALAPIRASLHPSDVSTEIMVGAAKFGAIFGTFLGGAFMLYYGRRLAISFDSIFFLVGPFIMACSASMLGLTVGRFLIGIGIGASAVVVPAYLGEIAPAKLRGRLVEVYEVMLCFGMLSAMLADAALEHAPHNWRWMVGAPIIPALVLTCAIFVLPESPRWLVVNARLDEALAVIHRIYTDNILPIGTQESTAEVEQELMELWSSVEKDKAAARERHQAVRRQRLFQKGWRHLRVFNGIKWQAFSPQNGTRQSPAATGTHAEGNGVAGQVMHSMATAEAGSAAVEEDKPTEPLLTRPGDGVYSNISSAEIQDSSAAAPLDEDKADALQLLARQASSELASTSDPSNQPLSTGKSVPAAGTSKAGSQGSPGHSPQHSPIRRALSDPTSLLYKTLSRIPDNLPPVRTSSGLETPFDATPSPLAPGRKAGLPERVSKGRGSGPSLKYQRESGFWRVLWDMLADIKAVSRGEEKAAFSMALWLAFFNQAMASSAIINYAPQLLRESGIRSEMAATLLTSTVTAAKMLGVFLGVALIDSAGRRPLLIWGGAGCCSALLLLFGGVFMQSTSFEIVAMAAFMLAFNSSYAGVFWVLISEIFSMTSKAPAASAGTAMMFTAGFLADSLFLTLLRWFGPYCFLLFASIAFVGCIYSYSFVPETMGRPLAEVQAIIGRQSKPRQLTKLFRRRSFRSTECSEAELSTQIAPHLVAAEEGKLRTVDQPSALGKTHDDEQDVMLPHGTLKSDSEL